MPAFLVSFFSFLAKFLLSGLIAEVLIKLILNGVVMGAMFQFSKNFSLTSLDYALSFFDFFGFSGLVNQIQYYWEQLPPQFLNVVVYFDLAGLMALIINNYIGSIFLAWVVRRFG
jgi:hypothetical protein